MTKQINIIILIAITVLLLAIGITIWIGCTNLAQRTPPLCSDYESRTKIDIEPLLMKRPAYIARRLSHLEVYSIIDSEHRQIDNYRLTDGSRLKVTYRDGLSIGFTIYHRIPYHTAAKSLETFGFNNYQLRHEEILPYSHTWTVNIRENRELKVYALRDIDFECYTMAQAFVIGEN